MLSQLRVLEKLSEGAAADLYLAQRHTTKEQVVLEVLRTEHLSDQDVRQRFLAEVQLRKGWNHPHLARRMQTGEAHNGRPYVISEPLSGHTLRRAFSAEAVVAPQDFMRLMLPLCDAVSFLHDHQTAHGNLCPESVFLPGGLKAFHPKLLDSGLSLLRVFSPGAADRVLVRPEYLSPERIQGQRFNAHSDIYALGILMYELLTGTPPFTDADIRTTRRRHLHDSAPPLPPELAAFTPVLERCIAKEPKNRFESALALRDALAKLWKAAYNSRPVPPPGKGQDSEGQVMGSYRLERRIGEGAMGAVYEGRHLKLDRRVALKVLKPELSANSNFVERFFQEAKAANRIHHEHIVEIQDYIDEPSNDGGPRYACVMELLEGKSLGQVLRAGPIKLSRIIHIAAQTCDALAAAHKAGVIHRDIKPDNIFLAQRKGDADFVKVLDFGIAKLSFEGEAGEGLTRNGEILGTPEYMAPEQLAGRSADVRTDIYSMGSVLYRMIAGRPPFKGRNLGEQLSLLVNAPPKPLDQVTAAGQPIPPGLRKLVFRCLDKNPDQRPQSMHELRSLLTPFAQAPEPEMTTVGAPVWSNTPTTKAPSGGLGTSTASGTGFELLEESEGLDAPMAIVSNAAPLEFESLDATRQEPTSHTSGRFRQTSDSSPRTSRTPGNGIELNWQRGTSRMSAGTVLSAQRPSPPPAPRSSHFPWVAAALVVAVAVGGLATYRGVVSPAPAEASEGSELRDLAVTSTPAGADVYRADSNEFLGITPFRATFREGTGALMLRFERPGKPAQVKTVKLGVDHAAHVEFAPTTSRR